MTKLNFENIAVLINFYDIKTCIYITLHILLVLIRTCRKEDCQSSTTPLTINFSNYLTDSHLLPTNNWTKTLLLVKFFIKIFFYLLYCFEDVKFSSL